ncbi:MAG TPA: hypothetical protein VF533_03400 [Solirubrobacteraceae bacterium]|jgi:hypothetical protein
MAVHTALTPPSVIEKEIEARIDRVWQAEGYVDEDGERDPKAMNDAAFAAVSKRVAMSKEERSENAITKGELYREVFPHGPGADGTDEELLDEFDQIVFQRLERDAWSLMQAKSGGYVNKRLADEGSDLILCQAKIRRDMNPVLAVYLTSQPALILEDAVDKEIKAYERKAQNLRRELESIMNRTSPELAATIMKRLGQGVNRTRAELTFPDDAVPSLEAGKK